MKEILDRLESEIRSRGLVEDQIAEILKQNKDIVNRRIIGGYASVSAVDRENQKIPVFALKKAVERFMKNIFARPVMVFHCLVPETKIFTFQKGHSKYEQIKDIKVGDKVYSHTGNIRKVNKIIKHKVNALILEINLSNKEIIRVTNEHPILTRDRGWVKAGELTTSDILLRIVTKFFNNKKGRISYLKNKTYEEYFGIEKAKKIKDLNSQNRKGKGIGKRDHYALTEKHNSRDRKGKTWVETYGHSRPNYGGNAGSKNPNWQNGISNFPYTWSFNKAIKNKIRIRDNYICQLCGKTEDQELADYNRKLSIHHIDYDKQNISDTNLTSLCDSCNGKVNYNRNYWTGYFQEQVSNKLQLVNGTEIKSIKWIWYTGTVYNLEIDIDHTYAGRGIIYHNSDIQCGRILPFWTNPETGETLRTEVNDKGWYVLVELRDDIEIANKVWDEILKGNIRSFSIAGSSRDKLQKQENGRFFEQINDLDLYECTLCEVPVNSLSKFEILFNPQKIEI